MATFYLDYEGGNDSNDGTTFANRWKTITSGATAARIAPGDTIKVMGSPNPTSLGTTGSFTNKSATVTLGSARNALITDGDTAWTASANVTCTADTTYFRGVSGDKSAKIAIASGFTTGLAAYFALGAAQNYSTYQGITFWCMIQTASSLAANTLSIRLCSDTAGVTTVDTLAIPAQAYTGRWFPVYINKGSALGASIQSIALYCDLDPGACDVYLDNISTTRAAGDDCLNLQTLIGKNTGGDEMWYPILNINGTTVKLDFWPGIAYYQISGLSRGYSGVTESVTAWIRKTIATDQPQFGFTVVQELQDSGSAGSLITFSGGWDRTAMTTQNLDGTYFDGCTGYGYGIRAGSKSYYKFDKIGCYRYSTGWHFTGAGSAQIGTIWAGGCDVGVNVNISDSTIDYIGVCPFGSYGVKMFGSDNIFTKIVTLSGGDAGVYYGYGFYLDNENIFSRVDTLITKNCRDGINGLTANNYYWIFGTVTSADHARYGWVHDNGTWANWTVKALTATGCSSHGAYLGMGTGTYNSITTSGNTSGGIIHGNPGNYPQDIVVLKSSLAETTKFDNAIPGTWHKRTGIRFRNFNGTSGDHRLYAGGRACTVFSENSVRHTASGLSWKISPTTTTMFNSNFPFIYPLAKLAVNASATVTVSVWMRRTNTGITGKLVCRGGQLAGIENDVSSSITAAADTWEKVTITLGPTEAGVIELEVHVYGGTTYSLYIDDFSAQQA